MTIQALADMDIQILGKKYPMQVAFLIKNPDGLRMETIPIIGPPDFMVSVQSDRLRVFIPEKGEFYTGRASKHLSRFLPIPIPVEDMIALLAGNHPPLRAGDCYFAVSTAGELRQVDIRDVNGATRQSLWIKWPEQTLMKLRVSDNDGDVDYTAGFSEYSRIGQFLLPQKISIRTTRGDKPGIQKTISIRYTDMAAAADTASPLELSPPPGIRPMEIPDYDEGK